MSAKQNERLLIGADKTHLLDGSRFYQRLEILNRSFFCLFNREPKRGQIVGQDISDCPSEIVYQHYMQPVTERPRQDFGVGPLKVQVGSGHDIGENLRRIECS